MAIAVFEQLSGKQLVERRNECGEVQLRSPLSFLQLAHVPIFNDDIYIIFFIVYFLHVTTPPIGRLKRINLPRHTSGQNRFFWTSWRGKRQFVS
jgi:hypothetical protein